MNQQDSTVSWGESAAYPALPWHQAALTRLNTQRANNRLGHALLISGEVGTGVQQFMYSIAAGLLCKEPQNFIACGQCRSCQLLASGAHPDAKYLHPEDAKVIKIDQVREVISFANTTAQQGGYRIIMIAPAEALNLNGANALLKLLEEPGENTVLLLASYAPAALMATLRSRCQKLLLAPPSLEQSKAWLQQQSINSDGFDEETLRSPLTAYDLHHSGDQNVALKVQAALDECLTKKIEAGQFAKQLSSFSPLLVADVLYAKCVSTLKNAETLAQPAVFDAIDSLCEWRRQLLAGASLNTELYLQSWAINLIKAPTV